MIVGTVCMFSFSECWDSFIRVLRVGWCESNPRPPFWRPCSSEVEQENKKFCFNFCRNICSFTEAWQSPVYCICLENRRPSQRGPIVQIDSFPPLICLNECKEIHWNFVRQFFFQIQIKNISPLDVDLCVFDKLKSKRYWISRGHFLSKVFICWVPAARHTWQPRRPVAWWSGRKEVLKQGSPRGPPTYRGEAAWQSLR